MSGRFLSELTVKRLADGRWRLTTPLVFESLKAARTIEVPAGFETDFASVPRLPFAYLLFAGMADEAAVVHDFLYSEGVMARKMADEVFSEAMQAQGLSSWRRGLMWFGVRAFGGSHYTAAPRVKEDPPRELDRDTLLE